MSLIRWNKGDSNIYIQVNSRWYRYDTSLSPVGEGAMGLVYLGFDCTSNEKVAVKVLRQEYWGDSHIRMRLKLEASIQINHPNLIRMIGFCEDSSGRGPLFVLSEYVCGVTFDEHIQQLTEWGKEELYDKVVKEFLPVLDAVGCLHSYGIVHRDIKPSNIMFQDGCCLKLMDLGIAKADYFFDAHLKGFTGTMPFAAPEQRVKDDVEAELDETADIYAAGVTLSYLLVNHFPIIQYDKVPKSLAAIISKATMSDREYRFRSAGEMKQALEDYIDCRRRRRFPISRHWIAIIILLVTLVLYVLIHLTCQ